ncbi:ribulose-phosphate 3-epimerase [Chloroflexota bacterium]
MNNPSRVVPAVLTDDAGALANMLHRAEAFADYLQIDIMDGIFVPSSSITAKQLLKLSIKTTWEAHLMVNHPQDYLEDFKSAGVERVIFHLEATKQPLEVFKLAGKLGLPVGLAVNPYTPVSAVLPFSAELCSLLFLSVNPGFYSNPFIPKVLDKIKQFRSLCPDVETGIDGGIKEDNIAMVAQTGVNYICVGSAIFMQADPAASYQRLSQLAVEASSSL